MAGAHCESREPQREAELETTRGGAKVGAHWSPGRRRSQRQQEVEPTSSSFAPPFLSSAGGSNELEEEGHLLDRFKQGGGQVGGRLRGAEGHLQPLSLPAFGPGGSHGLNFPLFFSG